jgi:hypothetical protein
MHGDDLWFEIGDFIQRMTDRLPAFVPAADDAQRFPNAVSPGFVGETTEAIRRQRDCQRLNFGAGVETA